MNFNPKNAVIAKARSQEWKESLVKGKLDAIKNPSEMRVARVKMVKTQGMVARGLKLSLSTYTAIERGLRLVDKSRAKVIANYFNAKVQDLFKNGDDDKLIAK